MLKKVEVPKPLLAPRQIEISPRLPAEFEDIKLPVLERRARIFNSIDHHCAACLCKVSAKDEGSAIHLAKVYFPEIVEDSNGKISQIRVGKDGELITIDKLKTEGKVERLGAPVICRCCQPTTGAALAIELIHRCCQQLAGNALAAQSRRCI